MSGDVTEDCGRRSSELWDWSAMRYGADGGSPGVDVSEGAKLGFYAVSVGAAETALAEVVCEKYCSDDDAIVKVCECSDSASYATGIDGFAE